MHKSDFNLGCIIGQVDLVDCIRMSRMDISKLSAQELAFGFYSPERYAWIMKTPIRYKTPVPAKGSLGIWEYNQEGVLV